MVANGTLRVWEACLLGLVQGLTEFLPVSSSGHLAVMEHFLAPMSADQKVAIDVALHAGTLVAVVAYFRRDLLAMAGALVGRPGTGYARSWSWLLVLATVPAAAVGLTLRARIESVFDSLPMIGACFLVTGILLFLASAVVGARRDAEKLTARDAFVIGCFQAVALLPGVSRSGSTISAGLFRRARAEVAARFSFLMAIPAIAGAIAVEGRALFTLAPEVRVPLVAGIVTAGVTGVLAIALLLRLLRGEKLRYFAYYCWVLGVLVLVGSALTGAA